MIISGFMIKLGDEYSEAKHIKKKWYLSVSLGFISGVLILYTALLNPLLIPLFLGVIAGNLLATKVDHLVHYFTAILIALPLAFYIVPEVQIPLMVLFTVASFADEYAHEHHQKPLNSRPFLPISTLLLFPTMDYFIATVAFDLGYRVCEMLIKKNH